MVILVALRWARAAPRCATQRAPPPIQQATRPARPASWPPPHPPTSSPTHPPPPHTQPTSCSPSSRKASSSWLSCCAYPLNCGANLASCHLNSRGDTWPTPPRHSLSMSAANAAASLPPSDSCRRRSREGRGRGRRGGGGGARGSLCCGGVEEERWQCRRVPTHSKIQRCCCCCRGCRR